MAEIKNYLPVIINNLITSFENPVGLARPLWRDYSRYQGVVNADVAVANGVLGMAHRSTISTTYRDAFFAANYASFGKVEKYRTSYHVVYPDQPVNAQLDNWYAVHPELDHAAPIPRVIDLELHRNQPAAKIASVVWTMSEVILERDGLRPIIYSRKNLIDSWLAGWTLSMLNDHYWWLAQYLFAGYLEHPGEPALPVGVNRNRVILHQTSDHKLAPPGEVASKAVDWDRWEIGNEEQMHQWIKDKWGGGVVTPVPPPPGNEIVPIDHLRVTASALNMRAKPDGGARDIGTLLQNSDVSITTLQGDWGKVEGWIHTGYTQKI